MVVTSLFDEQNTQEVISDEEIELIKVRLRFKYPLFYLHSHIF